MLSVEVNFGYQRVLAVRAARFIGTIFAPSRTATVFSIVIAAFIPAILSLGLQFSGSDLAYKGVEGLVWLAACSCINCCMLASALIGWRLLHASALEIDRIVTDPSDIAALARWMRVRQSFWLQILVAMSCALIAVSLFAITAPDVRTYLEVKALSYLGVFYTAFLGGNVTYWLFVVAEIPLRLRRCATLDLIWFDPAHTKAIVKMCDMYFFAAAATFVGVFGIELLGIAVPAQDDLPVVSAIVAVFPLLAATVAVWVGAQPILSLQRLVQEFRRRQLHQIQGQLGVTGLWTPHDEDALLRKYEIVRDAPTLPINSATVVQYVAALSAVVFTFLIARFVGS